MFNPTETNFIGRDPMQWIGQVTDPEKGEWGNSLEKTRVKMEDSAYIDAVFVLLDIMVMTLNYQTKIYLRHISFTT